MSLKVLVSGFGPFEGVPVNPTSGVVARLSQKSYDFEVKGIVLPVSFEQAAWALVEAIKNFMPDRVLALGVAPKRRAVTPEKYAKNRIDARIPDNDGFQPRNTLIEPNGLPRLESTLPIHQMVEACSRINIPASVSEDAGEYVCNYVFYKLMQLAREHSFKAGFIHVPLEISEEHLDRAIEAMLNWCGKRDSETR